MLSDSEIMSLNYEKEVFEKFKNLFWGQNIQIFFHPLLSVEDKYRELTDIVILFQDVLFLIEIKERQSNKKGVWKWIKGQFYLAKTQLNVAEQFVIKNVCFYDNERNQIDCFNIKRVQKLIVYGGTVDKIIFKYFNEIGFLINPVEEKNIKYYYRDLDFILLTGRQFDYILSMCKNFDMFNDYINFRNNYVRVHRDVREQYIFQNFFYNF